MTVYYLDPVDGDDAADGLSFANRRKTLSDFTAGEIAAGDTIRVMSSLDATSLGAATWTNGSRAVTLAGACTLMVDSCDAAWTASANVTDSTDTTNRREGTGCRSLAVASGFTTGIIAYKALAGSTDYSTYQQICLWVRASAAISANVLRVDLCSDAVGAVPVDSFTIPFAIDPANRWHAVVIDKGSALGSAIQSVSIVALSDPGTVTILIDDVFAAKAPTAADCLTLNSLIAPAQNPNPATAGEFWHQVRSVNGTTIEYDQDVTIAKGAATEARTYIGSTGSVTTYVRNPIMLGPVTGASTPILGLAAIADGGSAGNRVTVSGGWNRTDMSTQTGETFVSTVNNLGVFGSAGSTTIAYVTWSKFGFCRASRGVDIQNLCHFWSFTDCWFLNMAVAPLSFTLTTIGGNAQQFTRCHFGFQAGAITRNGTSSYQTTYDSCNFYGSFHATDGPVFMRPEIRFVECTFRNSASAGLKFGPTSAGNNCLDYQLQGCTFSDNATADIVMTMTQQGSGPILGKGNTLSSSTKVSQTSSSADVFINEDDGGAGVHKWYNAGYTIAGETSVRHTASGISWKISPTNAEWSVENPVKLRLGAYKVNSGSQVTFKAWLRRTNTALNLVLAVPKQYGVISAEVTQAMTAAADTWEEVTLTFTPAAAGVVQVYAYAYGGTTHSGYVDDLTRDQA